MKALTIKQPWASLIAHGIKDIENRTWRTHFRGKIYIHASTLLKKEYLADMFSKEQFNFLKENEFLENIKNVKLQSIIGEVEIIDCVINHESIWAEQTFYPQDGEAYQQKPIYNWVLSNAVLYQKPIFNVKGALSFWEPKPNQICQVCDGAYFGHEPEYCCRAFDCGCAGQPLEPSICSEKCYNKIMNK